MNINAFHPDYVKTHAKEFLSEIKQDNKNMETSKSLSKYVAKKRKVSPSHGTMYGITKPAHVHRPKQKQTMIEIHNELIDMSIFKKKEKK